MTRAQYNKAEKLMGELSELRLALDKNDPAREHVFRAWGAMLDCVQQTVPTKG